MGEKREFGQEPAFPVTQATSIRPGEIKRITTGGLTKREHFAAMAMQGMVTYCSAEGVNVREAMATAVQYADALLAELEKEK
jgi:hypothetical protein